MTNLKDYITIMQLHRKKVPIKRIAKQLGISKNTVKAMIKRKTEPKYTRNIYPTKIDKYKDKIEEWRMSPEYNFNGTRIFRELKKIGYVGSISPIYRYLKKIDEKHTNISSKATVRIESPPGDQAQFDWSPYEIKIGNEICTVYCFALVLSFSRIKKIVFSLKSDAIAIYDAIQDLFKQIGGVTRELLIDNPKALVLENKLNSDEEVKFNIDALRLANHLGIELNACKVYRARTKGKVENTFKYIEEQFVKGNTFRDMSELNKAASEFIDEVNSKIHSTTRRVPQEAFLEEFPTLLPLPKKHFFHTELERRKVSLDSFVSVNANKYSVPVQYVEKTVLIKISYGYKLEIYDDKENLINSWELAKDKHLILKEDKHYEEISSKTPKSIPQIKREFSQTFTNGSKYLEQSNTYLQQPSYHARKILSLLELYSKENLEKILEYCISQNIYSIEKIKEVIKTKGIDILWGNLGAPEKAQETEQYLTRDCSYYADMEVSNGN